MNCTDWKKRGQTAIYKKSGSFANECGHTVLQFDEGYRYTGSRNRAPANRLIPPILTKVMGEVSTFGLPLLWGLPKQHVATHYVVNGGSPTKYGMREMRSF